MPGKKWASLGRPDIYERLRQQGMDKAKAAAIANSHATAADWAKPPSKRKKPDLFPKKG